MDVSTRAHIREYYFLNKAHANISVLVHCSRRKISRAISADPPPLKIPSRKKADGLFYFLSIGQLHRIFVLGGVRSYGGGTMHLQTDPAECFAPGTVQDSRNISVGVF